MRLLWAATDFLRAWRRERRHCEILHAPLNLLRVEWRSDTLECDWMARRSDNWETGCRQPAKERDEATQALLDAIAVRNLVFDAFPKIDCAVLRGFRQPAREPPEMILLGTVSREMPEVQKVSSLAMRAKLYGFCFELVDGILAPMQAGESNEEFISLETTHLGQGGVRNGGK
jgi:hypothetical protein